MNIIRNGVEIELSYEELQQAVKEFEQRENIFATQKWTLGDIEDILHSDEDVESFTDEDIRNISLLAKEELENCSDNSEFIQNVVARYFNEKSDVESIIDKEKIRQIDITKEDIRCTDELMVNADYIDATYELWFDVDRYFGTNTKEDDSTWINFYTCWYPDGKMTSVCVLASDGKDTEIPWELTEEEIEFFRNKMESYCQEQNNMSLQEMWNSHNNDDNDDNDDIIKAIDEIYNNDEEGLFGFIISENDTTYVDTGSSLTALHAEAAAGSQPE
ncbi:MAG: hypothetical protein UHN47_05625 [Lachnospiraceae bacterium]|nr:hypothetical protein [Lachnospiraceae bacterium]